MASAAASTAAGGAEEERRILLKMRLNALGRNGGSESESWTDIFIRADDSAERYVGRSVELALTSGGEDSRDSMIVGRLVRTDGLAPTSVGGGERRCARRE